jgi:hypothetical protein
MTTTIAAETAARAAPLRYYVFKVPGWSELHDRVVDEAAVRLLEIQIAIDKSVTPVEVLVAENPEPLVIPPYEVRRFKLFAIILANPDIAGRWQLWLDAANAIVTRFPADISMKVTNQSTFDLRVDAMVDMARRSDSPPPVAGIDLPMPPKAPRRKR